MVGNKNAFLKSTIFTRVLTPQICANLYVTSLLRFVSFCVSMSLCYNDFRLFFPFLYFKQIGETIENGLLVFPMLLYDHLMFTTIFSS